MELLSLELLKKKSGCDALGTWFSGVPGSAELIFGLSGLKGLFKPKSFCDSMNSHRCVNKRECLVGFFVTRSQSGREKLMTGTTLRPKDETFDVTRGNIISITLLLMTMRY